MATKAQGSFEVKMTPQAWSEGSSEHNLGRFLMQKTFHGDIEGISEGQMLSAGSAEKGSAGYVAIEKITGTLQGRKGTFALQHSGTMNKGNLTLNIAVVPGTGTDELSGLSGTFEIKMADGKHTYEFSYTLGTIQ